MIDKTGAYITVVWALLVARTKEYYRDRGALIWSLIFPACVIAAIAIAFSEDTQEVLRIGVYQPVDSAELDLPLLDEPYVKRIHYTNMEQALERVRLHQLDLLLSTDQPGAYWINELSNRGLAAEQLLLGEGRRALLRQSVSGREVRYVDWVLCYRQVPEEWRAEAAAGDARDADAISYGAGHVAAAGAADWRNTGVYRV